MRKKPHVFEIGGRKALHLRKSRPQVNGKPINHLLRVVSWQG